MAWLEGGGDDDVAALGLLRAQEDAAGVDVDGARGPVLQAVHAVLAVLLHLPGRSAGSHRAPLSSHPASPISLPSRPRTGKSTVRSRPASAKGWGGSGGARWMTLGDVGQRA